MANKVIISCAVTGAIHLTITNKILQYLNAGLAIYASDTAGQREVLGQEPAAGVIVALDDTAAAAAALERMTKDKEELTLRQTAARRLAKEVYCWEKEAPRLLAAVEGALSGGPSAQRPIKRSIRNIARSLARLGLRTRSTRHSFAGKPSMLIVAPHDDDASLGCGALIAECRSQGCAVAVVCVTDGAASHPGHPILKPPALAARRRLEMGEAMVRLGIGPDALTFLEAPDGTLAHLGAIERDQLEGRLAAVFERVRPDEVYLPCRSEGSSEHSAAFGLAECALARAGLRPRLFEYPIWAWWDPRRLLPFVFKGGRVWRVNAADTGILKRQAIAAHATQVEPTPPWKEPILPRDFAATLSRGEEFYFERQTGRSGRKAPA